jgi:hypothetical protein
VVRRDQLQRRDRVHLRGPDLSASDPRLSPPLRMACRAADRRALLPGHGRGRTCDRGSSPESASYPPPGRSA